MVLSLYLFLLPIEKLHEAVMKAKSSMRRDVLRKFEEEHEEIGPRMSLAN